ncbi:hypothetical protein ATE37_02615 [Streptococcus oralis subsp. tigurinus]|uniref:Endonuclease GajA/Old nuclease/RecF-like AAA domain-containing protein n=1 Tax=Streptococcus oralis subsp. tigurinus TaxID=1077464 RepID=A0A1X0WZX2_STROR|nr:AAA family ATPase [Streptococcus oralis]ORJ32229.1 hypothetical protein ATE37_02615 [Streptococcus oralis subsp. tigurinus]
MSDLNNFRISSFSINGLFGTFNHSVFLKDDGITIIIGKNGIGKTYFLNAIDNFFSLKWEFFIDLEFDSIEFVLNDGSRWTVNKVERDDKLLFEINESGKKEESFEFDLTILENISKRSYYSPSDINQKAIEISKIVPTINKISYNRFLDGETGLQYSRTELIEEFGNQLVQRRVYSPIEKEKITGKIAKIIDANKTEFVETQRIYNIEDGELATRENITYYAKELVRMINETEKEYNEVSVKLDSNFVFDLVNYSQNNPVDEHSILNRYNELIKKTQILSRMGLLSSEENRKAITIEQAKESANAIDLYIRNTEEKLKKYDKLKNNVSLFKKIINERFEHKELYIDRDKGFLVKSTSVEKRNIPLHKLSSGEKNEFNLFFKLIFLTDKDSIILIDEPEISLHVEWQNAFIQDLQGIIEKNNFRVIIATHSPDIIDDNWALTNDLSGVLESSNE